MAKFTFPKINRKKLTDKAVGVLEFAKTNKRSKTKKVVLVIGGLVALYLICGLVFGGFVYKQKAHSRATQTALKIFPFPAVYVDGYLIKVSTIYKRVNYATTFSKESGQKIESIDVLRNRAIDQEIENVLVMQEMARLKLKIDPKAIDSAYKDVISKNGGEAEVKKVLGVLYGMSPSDFKELIAIQLFKDKFREEGLERVKVRHILVADEGAANKLIEQLNKGEKKFEDAAKELSKDSNSKDNGGLIQGDDGKGGKVDKIAPGTMPAAFDEVIFTKAEVGKVYGSPVKTDFGFHVVRLEEKKGTIAKNYQKWLEDTIKDTKIIRFLK